MDIVMIVIAEHFKYTCLLGTFKEVRHKIKFASLVLNVKIYSSLYSPWKLCYFITIHRITPCAHRANLLIKSQTFYAGVMTQSSVEPARGCVTRAFIFLWRERENSQKRSQSDEQKTKTQQRKASYRGDEDLPEPKPGRAARSLQQPAQPQQQRREPTQYGQRHPRSPAHPDRPCLQQ